MKPEMTIKKEEEEEEEEAMREAGPRGVVRMADVRWVWAFFGSF